MAGCLRRVRISAWAALAALLVLAYAPGASAHADLVEADPPANTRVDRAPAELRLLFSEPLSDTYTSVRVIQDDVDRVASVTVQESDRRRLVVTLDPLPDGVHSVQWRTLSDADGHTRSGAYFLAVNTSVTDGATGGAAGGAADGFAARDTQGSPGEAVARAVAFIGMSLAAGLVLVAVLPGTDRETLQRRLRAGMVAGATTAGIGVLASAFFLAARIDTDVVAALATEPGETLALRGALSLAAALAYLGAHRMGGLRPSFLATGGLLSAAALLATSLGSHAAGETDHMPLAVTNDWVHLVAVSFWVSGVAAFVVMAFTEDERRLAAYIVAFSPLAVVAVLVIVATGTFSAFDRLSEPSVLWRTSYGGALLLKIVLMVPLLVLGHHHRYRVLPRLREAPHGPRRLRRTAVAEVLVMALVLFAAGALTNTSPPDDAGADADAAGGGAPPYHAFSADGLAVEVFIAPTPVRAGFQEVFVAVEPQDGATLDRAGLSAFMSFHEPGASAGEATPREGHFFHNETFHWGGALFTVPGEWTVTLVLQGGAGDDYVYVEERFTVDVLPAR